MTSAQVGKTLSESIVLGYFIDQDPSPTLMVLPTLEMAEMFSKERLAPMCRDIPAIGTRIDHDASTILSKTFAGGHLTLAGANSAASLASRPIRVLLCDEVDRFPPSAGTEGDPVTLARARTKTFWNRKIILASTPTDEETSRIKVAWDASDQRHFWVPCASCGGMQTLRWSQVKFTERRASTAHYECIHCQAQWGDAERADAVARGQWIAEFPDRRIVGFHLNELYSPWRLLCEIVQEFLDAKKSPERLKVWVNTSLGECWREKAGTRVDAEMLAARREPYTEPPPDALVVAFTVDVQDDRLEGEFVAYGEGEESWGLETVVLRGDPGRPELWDRLTDQLGRTFRRSDGAILGVSVAGIDTGGSYTRQAYAWVRQHPTRVYPLKGFGGPGLPLVAMGSRIRDAGVKLVKVGTDTAKDLILLSRARITTPGPGYMHFPAHYDVDFFEQLTAERSEVRYTNGVAHRVWRCPPHRRNEKLDIRVYSLAVIALYRPAWAAIRARLQAQLVTPARSIVPPPKARPPKRVGSFLLE